MGVLYWVFRGDIMNIYDKMALSEFGTNPNPTVGMGATLVVGTDRYPCLIIKVTPSKKTIVLQESSFERTDHNGMSEQQEYKVTPNPEGRILTATLRKDHTYKVQREDTMVIVGGQECYLDPCF